MTQKLTQLSFATLLAATCLTGACVEPSDSSEPDPAEETDKNGKRTMDLRTEATEKSFDCSEIFYCDVDIRAQRCATGAPTGRILGHLTLTNEDGEELVVAEVKDSPYIWLIGTNQPGQYANRIETLGARETFTLSYEPAPVPEPPPPHPPGSNLPPPVPLQPACINLTVSWS